MKEHKNTRFSSGLQFLRHKSRIPAFFFQNCRKFLQFKTLTPEAKKVGWKPDPQAVRRCKSLGVPRGDGQAWKYNWLIHYLVLTIWVHFSLSVHIFATINLQLWVLVRLENKTLSSTAVSKIWVICESNLPEDWTWENIRINIARVVFKARTGMFDIKVNYIQENKNSILTSLLVNTISVKECHHWHHYPIEHLCNLLTYLNIFQCQKM